MLFSYVKSMFKKSNIKTKSASSVFCYGASKPKWSGRQFSKFADEGYIKNVVAYRSVNMIINGAASINYKLYKGRGKKKKEISYHEVLDVLKKPNFLHDKNSFFQDIFGNLLISGNSFIHLTKSKTGVRELSILRPDMVEVLVGIKGYPVGYRYKTNNKTYDYKIDQFSGKSDVLHIKNYHPLDVSYGLSSFEAAAYSIDQHNQASIWNQSLLQNSARPSGILSVKNEYNGGFLAQENFDRLKNELDESFSGGSNAGRPLLLEGGLDWKDVGLSPKDMDFIEAKNSAARDIALAFGVPPQLLGIPGDNTYSNMQEARLALWEQTILPITKKVLDALSIWFSMHVNENLSLEVETDSILALSPRREGLWNRVNAASFLSDEEKRKILGL